MHRLIFPNLNYSLSRFFFSTSSNKISKILIANRGQIARRIIKTSKKLDIKTVAVYSDADRHSMFVREADEAYHIGASPSTQSYLSIEKIVNVIKKTGANGVHPGYGFLSQNPAFQNAVQQAGAKFIGPPEKAIIAMGDKIQSKKLARQAKVNTVPGFLGTVETDEQILKIANEIKYPVMIKASAGGGGKGMRIAWNDAEAIEGFKLSKQQAKSSFGDDRIFIEKYIQQPRHIEFQILGDKFGNYVYLPQRECSVQRRNQKVIEQAPSPIMNQQIRHKMGMQALQLAAKCGYFSTGTVEFLVDIDLNFYFLQMNTRLQVEHPITEQITGIDLVEQMIRIAQGHKLPMKQEDVKINGHSVEYRVYAEDPAKKFLPSIGFLKRYIEPPIDLTLEQNSSDKKSVRIDTGVQEGSQISMYYDPMISKLITHQKTRKQALNLMNKVVDQYVISGVSHNLAFCKAIISNQDFYEGNYNTNFIPNYFQNQYVGRELNHQQFAHIGLCAVAVKNWLRQNILQGKDNSQKQKCQDQCSYAVIKNQSTYVTVKKNGDENYDLQVSKSKIEQTQDNKAIDIALDSYYSFKVDPRRSIVILSKSDNSQIVYQFFLNNKDPGSIDITYDGIQYPVQVYNQAEKDLFKHMPPIKQIDLTKTIISPMPGTIVSVEVQLKQNVVAGQTLLIIQAMKMQNVIKAERDGCIETLRVRPGMSVKVDEVLIQFQ